DGRAGRGLDARGVRRMVAMGVCDENMRHRLAAHGLQECLRVRLAVRTGIEDRDVAVADDVAHRAGEGERARIVAEYTAHAGPDFLDDAGLEGKVAIERDVVGFGHGSPTLGSHAPRPGYAEASPGLAILGRRSFGEGGKRGVQ